jgi:cation diffusion facilitator CzcD-associated flavoprotein CzcO
MQDRRDRMAVIGAGPVGLGMAKALKERGIPYDQLEADDDVGGNWYHGVYRTAHIISSRKTTEYADYPMPAHYPDFPSRAQMVDYLRDYARHFGLRAQIEFGAKVLIARPRADELWDVGLAGGEQRVYKGLLVCNGHHWSKRWPDYPGRFAGEYIHTKDYRDPAQLAGKRVLVIGGGNSAWTSRARRRASPRAATLEPIQKVVESKESFVIPSLAPECWLRGAGCGSLNIAARRTGAACVTRAI